MAIGTVKITIVTTIFCTFFSNNYSLRDICQNLEAHDRMLYHLGFRKTVNRTSLSRAKGNRDYRIFEGLGPMLSMLWIRHTSISRLCSDSINPKLSGCLVPKRI